MSNYGFKKTTENVICRLQNFQTAVLFDPQLPLYRQAADMIFNSGLCALTAGLAAPLVAAGMGTVFGGGAAVLGSATGIAVITTLFGAAGGGLVGYKMKRRIGGLEEFRFVPITMGESLHLAIAVSGNSAIIFRIQYIIFRLDWD